MGSSNVSGLMKSQSDLLIFYKNFVDIDEGNTYTPLYSRRKRFILSAVELSVLSTSIKNWFLSFTKRVQERFPDSYFGFSERDNAWQVFSKSNHLLISVGQIASGEYIYVYSSGGSLHTGRTFNLKDLQKIIPKIGG